MTTATFDAYREHSSLYKSRQAFAPRSGVSQPKTMFFGWRSSPLKCLHFNGDFYKDYYEKLKAAGVPEEQAKVQANALRDLSVMQETNARNELATKGDIQDVRLEMKSMELRLLKWQIGIGVAIFTSIFTALARGFHWFGF